MYHALHPDGDVSAIDVADRPYAISLSTFKDHMARLREFNVGLLTSEAGEAQPDVVITFDDGHLSNHSLALPVLEQLGYQAYFFVTTDFIRSRAEHCRVNQLQDLHRAGMVVGSHGVSHRFLADLNDDEAKYELQHSRETLQDWLGADVDSFSFPGGRYTHQTLNAAYAAGYRWVFDSTFDTVSAPLSAQPGAGQHALARVAIRRTITTEAFQCMITGDQRYYARVQRTQKIKQSVKKFLGNRLYHGLYQSLSAR